MAYFKMCIQNKWLNLIILQNILFCVQQKKETRTVSEQLEGEKVMTELFYFLFNYPFNIHRVTC